MDIVFTILVMFLLVLLQGFFSGSEIALVNSDKIKLKHRAKQGHHGSRLVLQLFEKPERLLATTLIGTNIAMVSTATLGTIITIRYFGEGGDVLAFLLITPLMLIFGEVVPKSVYQQKSDLLAPILIYPLRFFSWILFPVIVLFSTLARIAARLVMKKSSTSDLFVAREKIRTLLDSAEQAPTSEIFDHQRIKHAIKYSDLTAVDVMIPMSDAILMNSEHSLQDAIELIIKTGYNRLPLFDNDASRIIGVIVISTWDMLDPDLGQRSISDFLVPAMFVAPTSPTEKLLTELQKRDDHMAIVVDEFGSAIGLLTSEDIMEEVVGEIEDIDFRLHKRHKRLYQPLEEGSYLVDAHLAISELNELLNLDIPSGEFHTVGGLMVNHLRGIPSVDEFIVEAGFRFTAIECDERMVKTIKVEPDKHLFQD
ncbi:MAG: hemolysin family protein [Gammaproteobacteria bacterium]|nr:hemolysin family protein [Gammaproteobacteria bacterium]